MKTQDARGAYPSPLGSIVAGAERGAPLSATGVDVNADADAEGEAFSFSEVS